MLFQGLKMRKTAIVVGMMAGLAVAPRLRAMDIDLDNSKSIKNIETRITRAGLEVQVVVRADAGVLPSGFLEMVRAQVEKVASQYDQPAGGRTVIRLNGVWQQLGGQWRLFFRVVADHLIFEQNAWTRLGDSQTVSVIELPDSFANTLVQAVDVAAQLAIEGKVR